MQNKPVVTNVASAAAAPGSFISLNTNEAPKKQVISELTKNSKKDFSTRGKTQSHLVLEILPKSEGQPHEKKLKERYLSP